MHTLTREVVVPYSARQMFELVNAVAEYPRFLPWCVASKIIEQSDSAMTASLEIAWKGIHKHFTTQNTLIPYERIEMHLIDGPFKHLEGVWQFEVLPEQACRVKLALEFELTGYLVDRFLKPLFEHTTEALVEAFCMWANVVYGGA